MGVLEVRNLKKYFTQNAGIVESLFSNADNTVKAVDNVSLSVEENDSIGVIGESGCGKSTLLKTLMGIHDPTSGEIIFDGKALSEFSKSDWKTFRERVSIVFQDPYNTLDPRMSVRESLMQPLQIHNRDNKEERIKDALRKAELRPPAEYLDRKPEQLSGGERQRVSVARAIILEPDILLADEPVSMLDVSTQSSILNLLLKLKTELDMAIVYISHDLSTVSYICDTVNVMYLGRIVEKSSVDDLLDDPLHPYSKALIRALPIPNPYVERETAEVEGTPQTPIGLGEGCRFRDRCPDREEICEITPRDVTVAEDKTVACHLYYDHEQDDTATDTAGVVTHE